METWKSVIGLEGRYEVSDMGRVRSVARSTEYKDGRVRNYVSNILKPRRDADGYATFSVRVSPKLKSFKIHREVLKAFVGEIEGKPEVNHKNGIKDDNRLENLEWVTSRQNKLHAIRTGLSNPTANLRVPKGAECWNSKTLVAYKDGVEVKRYATLTEAAKDGINPSVLRKQMLHGKPYKGMTFIKIPNERKRA